MQSSKSQCYIKQIAEQYFYWSFCNLSTKKLILSWFKILHRCVKVCTHLPTTFQAVEGKEERNKMRDGEQKESSASSTTSFCLLIKIYLKQINVSNCQFWIGYILVHILCYFSIPISLYFKFFSKWKFKRSNFSSIFF